MEQDLPNPSTLAPEQAQEWLDDELGDDQDLGDRGWVDLGSEVKVHDQFQVEASFDFALDLKPGTVAKRYEIDFFWFIPAAMGIHSGSYGPEAFYHDLTNHLRIRTPDPGRLEDMDPEAWVLPSLERYLSLHLRPNARRALRGQVEQDVKLFGCMLNTHLKRLLADAEALEKRRARVGALILLQVRLERLVALLVRFRSHHLHRVKREPVLVDEEVSRAISLVDEYLSYRLEATLIRVMRRLDRLPGQALGFLGEAQKILAEEMVHRAEEGYVNVAKDPGDGALAEAFTYRAGLLKRFVSEVLYLQVDSVKRDRIYRNFVAAAGAALAALWAGVTDFQRLQAMGTKDWGWRVFLVISIGVVAYVFKDRIKELSREYFNERLKGYLPDLDVKMGYAIIDPGGQPHRLRFGVLKEFMRFLRKEALPPEVRFVRDLGHDPLHDPERSEAILHYFKRLTITPDAAEGEAVGIRHIKDVVRLDLSEFLDKLSDPEKRLSFYDPRQGVRAIQAPKVYHLNLVLRLAVAHRREDGAEAWQVEYERVRLVMDKEGIVRLEPVLRRGELHDQLGFGEEQAA